MKKSPWQPEVTRSSSKQLRNQNFQLGAVRLSAEARASLNEGGKVLTAVHRNKTKLASHRYDASTRGYKSFVAKEKGDVLRYRRTQEDEIVSTVFGVLQYLPEMERTKLLIKWFLPNIELPDGYDMSEMRFWPSLRVVGIDAFRVEPDIVIEFNERLGKLKPKVVVVEAKWGSPPSGDDQLSKQWDAAKNEWDNPLHVFLVRSTDPQDVATNVYVDTWRELAGRIRQAQISQPTPEKHQLKLFEELLSFFEKLGISIFKGFGKTVFNGDGVLKPLNFWHRDFVFLGFSDRNFAPLVFWNEEKIK